MVTRIVGTITSFVFIIAIWFIYVLFPQITTLILAITVSVVVIFSLIKNYFFNKESSWELEKSSDIVRIIFSGFAFILFLSFLVISGILGGSAAEDSYASWGYDKYVAGQYYLTSHGKFTLVTYQTWLRIKVFEQIVMPLFLLAIVWDFIFLVKTKGIKFMLTGKSNGDKVTFNSASLLMKIGFIFLCLFLFTVSILILFTLF